MQTVQPIQEDVNQLAQEDQTLFNLYQARLQNIACKRIIRELEAKLEESEHNANGVAKEIPAETKK